MPRTKPSSPSSCATASSLADDDTPYISLQNYVDRMQSEQDKIYYLAGESKEAIAQSPLLEAFRKRGIEVLYLDEPVDEWVVQGLQKFADKEFVGVDAAELNLEADAVELEGVDDQKAEAIELLAFLKQKLAGRVEDVVESQAADRQPLPASRQPERLEPQHGAADENDRSRFQGIVAHARNQSPTPDHPQHSRRAQARPRLRAIGELGPFSG